MWKWTSPCSDQGESNERVGGLTNFPHWKIIGFFFLTRNKKHETTWSILHESFSSMLENDLFNANHLIFDGLWYFYVTNKYSQTVMGNLTVMHMLVWCPSMCHLSPQWNVKGSEALTDRHLSQEADLLFLSRKLLENAFPEISKGAALLILQSDWTAGSGDLLRTRTVR